MHKSPTKTILPQKRLLLKKAMIVFEDNRIILGSCCCGSWQASLCMRARSSWIFLRHWSECFFKVVPVILSWIWMWSQGIIFGVISVLYSKYFTKIHSWKGCRMLAKDMQDHIIVVGYSHLGQDWLNIFDRNRSPFAWLKRTRRSSMTFSKRGKPLF